MVDFGSGVKSMIESAGKGIAVFIMHNLITQRTNDFHSVDSVSLKPIVMFLVGNKGVLEECYAVAAARHLQLRGCAEVFLVLISGTKYTHAVFNIRSRMYSPL